MKTKPRILNLDIKAQPDDVTCGPTCLHAVYRYYNDDISLEQVIDEVKQLPTGGTLAVQLANHALRRGYKAIIYTYNLITFDLSWFQEGIDIEAKLKEQMSAKSHDTKLMQASEAYLKFLESGGEIRFEELTSTLLKSFLSQDLPVLTGLSATYLYESQRETGDQQIIYDDIEGQPTGHFVVINGFNPETRMAYVADPLAKNPISTEQYYQVRFRKLINSIMLGVMTYDANLLIIYPK
ncbi:peptidase-C39 like family protein [Fulvivirga sp. RKSG066]|nr:peptidase-C39 like family protein [Fulvivirga aurantia]